LGDITLNYLGSSHFTGTYVTHAPHQYIPACIPCMLSLQSHIVSIQGGYTALNKAAACGHLDVLELLINEGCDIDPQDDLVRKVGIS